MTIWPRVIDLPDTKQWVLIEMRGDMLTTLMRLWEAYLNIYKEGPGREREDVILCVTFPSPSSITILVKLKRRIRFQNEFN